MERPHATTATYRRPRPIDLKLADLREQRAREQRDRMLAVITEFGGKKRQPMLVPEDDPANNKLVLRLTAEVLFLRDQLQRIAKVMELVQAGKPFALLPHGPHGTGNSATTTVESTSKPSPASRFRDTTSEASGTMFAIIGAPLRPKKKRLGQPNDK